MALSFKINKAAYDALSADIKKEYSQDGDDYILDVSGIEDVGPLKRAHDRNKVKLKELEKQLNDTEAELETYKSDPKSRDIKSLEKSWNDKLNDTVKAKDGEIAKLTGFVNETLVNSVATNLAAEISNAPNLILPHILKRLAPDYSSDKPITKVLDKDGKPSALTLDDLKKELLTNKDFAPILIATRAKGAGGNTSPSKSAGGTLPQNDADLSRVDPASLVARINAKKGI